MAEESACSSPADFPAERCECDWPNRFRVNDLTAIGRRGLSFDDR